MNRSKFILPAVYAVICVVVLFWWFGRSSAKHLQERKTDANATELIQRKVATIPARAARLLFVDGNLYDPTNGELILKNWLGGDKPNKIFFDPKSEKFIGQFPRGFARYTLDGKREAEMAGKDTLAFSEGSKRAVFVKEKNVWTAETDWQNFRLGNERQVTTLSQFYEQHFAENLLLLTGKTLVVRNLNNLLRVNLENGEVKPMRIPLGNIGKHRSPNSKWVIGFEGSQLYCYDVDADEAKTVQVGWNNGISEFFWLDNDHCLGLAGRKRIVIYDRVNNSLSPVTELPFQCFGLGQPSPGGRFVFCIGGNGGVLVDVEKKTAERVLGGTGVTWLTKDTFAFSREVPDTSLRGTWLQTVGEKERRVSLDPYLVGRGGGQILAVPSAGLVVYLTKLGISKMKPDGTEVAELIKMARPAEIVLGIQEFNPLSDNLSLVGGDAK